MRLTLGEPYTIAYETITEVTNVFVRITTDGPHVGFGCAAPDLEVTGETPQSVVDFVDTAAASELAGRDPLEPVGLLERLRSHLFGHPSAMAAIDMALHDLLGKVAGLPLWRMLGGYRDRIETSVTIGILSEAETLERAGEWVGRGFRCLKLKGGRDVESDVARVLEIRERFGDRVEIRFDANQGYTVEQARRFATGTEASDVAVFEQPTPRESPELLRRVRQSSPIPVMADESMMSLQDAFTLARDGLADMLNIKLMKIGGIAEAVQADAVARSAGMPVMVGCMDEAEIAIAAGLSLALARPNVKYADLDGHLDLEGDPTAGTLRLENGVLYASEAAGLGFSGSLG